MNLSKEAKEKYLSFFSRYRSYNSVCIKDGTVRLKTSYLWGNGMGINDYYTFSVGKEDDKTVLRQHVRATESKWEFDDYGGESPNNGEWTTDEYTIYYQVPDNFDLFNPDFSQMRKIEKEHSRGRRK